jgi:cell division protein FtsQ
MPVSTPSDKRFRRAHVSPSRRRALLGWSWPRVAGLVAAAGLLTYGAVRGARALLATDALAVTTIAVSGNSRLSTGEVLALLEGLEGSNMVSIDLDDWRARLLGSPWVADAALRRVLPHTVDVIVSERAPMGIGRLGTSLYLLDHEGNVIDEYGPNYADVDLPIIDGLAASPRSNNGLLIDRGRAGLARRLLASLQDRPDLQRRISQIDVADARDAAVLLKGDTTLLRVGEDRFAERLQAYLDIAPALRERVPEMDYVDLRFDERVYVRPQPGSARRTSGGD